MDNNPRTDSPLMGSLRTDSNYMDNLPMANSLPMANNNHTGNNRHTDNSLPMVNPHTVVK